MSTIKTIQKRIAKLESELEGLRRAESALGGKPAKKASKPAKKASKPAKKATKAKAKTKAKPAKAQPKASYRPITPEHLNTVLTAIGSSCPATELKGRIDGRALRAFDVRVVLGKLKKLGCITGEGVKRNLVWSPTGLSVEAALAAKAKPAKAESPSVGPETDNSKVEAPEAVAEA